ncbi:hypothetical protein ARMGADRAFT_1166925 [Armillaria gallica]|uniref:Actin-like ATPase domain-containing protein n=1 Tax=Armillaria gallica TaxID=47427 RepID=A0A2H3D9Z4_ARMGA|nr:hypothetical protein ARMGADRAFT_1166925 [Armillaria gallica]
MDSPTQRQPYGGPHQRLVISFDLGTTFSAVSYCILDPGAIPSINAVTRFPSQEETGSDVKVPTSIFYDKSGKLKAIGAETLEPSIVHSAARNEWVEYYGFKLHLGSQNVTPVFGELPSLKDTMILFSDFYGYLYSCAVTYIQQTHHFSRSAWLSLERDIHFVLAHPNGWGGEQQALLRNAMVRAELIPKDNSSRARVSFVTEGEASLHFCLSKGLSGFSRLDEGVMIIDAGGGTVDISTYSRAGTSRNNKSYEEIAIPQCTYSGSIFVTKRAKSYLQDKFKGTTYAEDIDNISKSFDKTSKLRFKTPHNSVYIQFGRTRDNAQTLGITAGQLKLIGNIVAGFFDTSVNDIIEAIDNERFACSKNISAAFLVGGFAASEYLYSRLSDHLQPLGIMLSRPDSHVNKAVADGAISFYIDHAVTARMSRYFYGASMFTSYDSSDFEHRRRSGKTYVAINGEKSLDAQFDIILPKGISVSENTEFRNICHFYSHNLKDLATISDDIICYRGSQKDPRWMDTEEAKYKVLCRVTADAREAAKSLELQRRPDGKSFFKFDYELVLVFGLTELQAYVSWKHKGKEKRGPASIIYQKDL